MYTDHVQDLAYTGNIYKYIIAESSIKRKEGNARARKNKKRKMIINKRSSISINENQLRREERRHTHTHTRLNVFKNCITAISPLFFFRPYSPDTFCIPSK